MESEISGIQAFAHIFQASRGEKTKSLNLRSKLQIWIRARQLIICRNCGIMQELMLKNEKSQTFRHNAINAATPKKLHLALVTGLCERNNWKIVIAII
jgi:hypothetical protein